MEQKENHKKCRTIIIFLIVTNILTLILLGFFVMNYFQTDKKLLVTEERLVSSDSTRMELDTLLKQTALELDQFKGRNAQLDQFLGEKNDSLQQYAKRIQTLLKAGRVTKEELEKAKDELDLLRYYKRKYLGQIDSLSTVIVGLNKENETLKTDIGKQKRKYEDLSMDNARLSNKVAIGAKLITQGMQVIGVKLRSNGKEKETQKASQTEQIKVSFTIAENFVSDKGSKEIYLKIIGPDGATVYNQSAGSGTFMFQNEESLYSTKKTIEFNQVAQQVSLYWNTGNPLLKGKYRAEIYCEGFKIGQSDFELK
jgi:DNA repair ATPase RecN